VAAGSSFGLLLSLGGCGSTGIAVWCRPRAGAVILGKTNATEFGYGGVGHNPIFPTGRHLEDRTVIKASAAFERVRPWIDRLPML